MARMRTDVQKETMLFAAFMTLTDLPESPLGRWANPSGSVIIEIAPCGPAYCGTVVAATAKAKADAARGGTKALIGATLLTGFTAAAEGRWKGRLFVPDINRRTKGDLVLVDANNLKVRGCAIGMTLCKSQLWTRAD